MQINCPAGLLPPSCSSDTNPPGFSKGSRAERSNSKGFTSWQRGKLIPFYLSGLWAYIAYQGFDQQMAEKMVSLLEDYVTLLQDVDAKVDSKPSDLHSYFLPSEIISPTEWEEFENVYHIHCPSIFLDAAVRDVSDPHVSAKSHTQVDCFKVMIQYYYCSQARRGLEYHMATRFVTYMQTFPLLTHPLQCSQVHTRSGTSSDNRRLLGAWGKPACRSSQYRYTCSSKDSWRRKGFGGGFARS